MKLIVFFIIIWTAWTANLGYDQASLYNCNANYTEQQERSILKLYPIDEYILVILGPFSFISSSLIIACFFLFPACRKTPGDIVFSIACWDLINSIYLMISGWYGIIYKNSPNPLGTLCQTLGVIGVMCFMGNYIYNIFFSFSPIMYVSQTLSKRTKAYKIGYHAFAITMVISFGISVWAFEMIYLNLSGICFLANYSKNKGGFFQSLTFAYLLIIYIVCATVSVWQFKKAVPKSETLRENRKKILNYYQKFVIATTIMYSIQLALSLINKMNCFYFQNPKINVTLTLYNIGQILTPINKQNRCNHAFDFRIQSSDAKSEHYLIPFLIKILRCPITYIELTVYLDSTNYIALDRKENFLRDIQTQLRTTQVYSMLAGILLMRKKQKNDSLDFECSQLIEENEGAYQFSSIELPSYRDSRDINFSDEDVTQKAEISMDNDLVKKSIPNFLKEYEAFKMKITFYAPKVFHHFLEHDFPMVNLEESLDLEKNSDKIQKFGGPDGGKSGEFFYFTHDNRIIIKTMQVSELMAIRKRMLDYSNYLYNRPDSLISKLYGIYTFERLGVDQNRFPKVHILIQRNISFGIPRQFILRTFDMKGSEYDREVLKKSSADLSTLTLKDLDFFKLEEKIWIDEEVAKIMLKSLTNDANFFKGQRLIDYSLLLFKVDWLKFFEQTGKNLSDVNELIINPLYMVESTREKGIYYHVAIIDYLQEWNINKGVEQATKKLINLNCSLDTSAQNPDVYADRFIKKLIERILLQ